MDTTEQSSSFKPTELPAALKAVESDLLRTLAAGQQAAQETAKRQRQLAELVAQLPPEQLPEAARRGLELPPELCSGFLSAILQRWAEYKGVEAMAFAASRTPIEIRASLVSTVLEHWTAKDPSGVLGWLRKQPESKQRLDQLQQFIRATEWDNPTIALAAFEILPRRERQDAIRNQLALRLAEKDIPAAMAALIKAPADNVLLQQATVEIAARWLEQNPAAAMAWGKQLRNKEERANYERHLAAAWARKDVNAVLQWVNSQPAHRREELFSGLLEQWTKQDAAAAGRYVLTNLTGQERETGLFSVAVTIGLQRNPKGFLDIYQHARPEGGSVRSQLYLDVVRHGNLDIREGANVLTSQASNEGNQRMLDRYLAWWLSGDRAAAEQFLNEHDLLGNLPGTARFYGLIKAREKGEATLEWARSIPAGIAREQALYGVISGLAQNDPSRAVALATQELPTDLQPDVLQGIAGSWFTKDRTQAIAWAQSLSDEASRAVACAEIVYSWSARDPSGPVVSWIETLPAGSTYDLAVVSYTKNIMSTDPDAALTWTTTIGDEQLRQIRVEELASDWLSKDRKSATQWIEKASLSPVMKQRILSGR